MDGDGERVSVAAATVSSSGGATPNTSIVAARLGRRRRVLAPVPLLRGASPPPSPLTLAPSLLWRARASASEGVPAGGALIVDGADDSAGADVAASVA